MVDRALRQHKGRANRAKPERSTEPNARANEPHESEVKRTRLTISYSAFAVTTNAHNMEGNGVIPVLPNLHHRLCLDQL
jgi:hypothetical protein